MPMDAVLRPVLDTVLDAVVVMDRAGMIRQWNGPAEATFGWTTAEAIGQNLDIIIPPELRAAHHRGLARFNQDGVPRVLGQRLELTGLRRDGSEFPIELAITLVSHGERELFVGFLRDISERRRAEANLALQLRESRLMFELSELGNRDGTFEEALAAALDAICELAEWPIGHAFVVDDDDSGLRSLAWCGEAGKLAPELVEATEAMRFERGVGLPGRVLESGQPVWVPEIALDDNFPRQDFGFRSAFAFPVFSGKRCIAVLEFLSADSREPDPSLMLSARAIGAQVGRVFERKRNEELRALLLAELDHRAKNILSVVRGMAHLSFGAATDLSEAQKAFDRRLESIAQANSILRQESGNSALLGDIVRQALAGCGADEGRVAAGGPDLCIDSSSAIMVSLAVHELCTNAFKYGALSGEDGKVSLEWREASDDSSRFELDWVEQNGPPVVAPRSKGFGTRILGRGMESATGGKAAIAYEPDGFRYHLTGARHGGPPGTQARAA